MATTQAVVTVSVTAGSAVTVYRFVAQATGDSKYDHSGTQGQIDGVSAEGVAADGDVFPMAIPNGGIVKVETGAAVTVGTQVASDSTGRAIGTVDLAGNFRGGRALTASAAAGEVIEVQFLVDEDQVT